MREADRRERTRHADELARDWAERDEDGTRRERRERERDMRRRPTSERRTCEPSPAEQHRFDGTVDSGLLVGEA